MSLKKRLMSIALVAALALGVGYVGYKGVPITEKKTTASEDVLSMQKETLYLWYTDEQLSEYLDSIAVAYNNEQEHFRVVPELRESSEFLEGINAASVENDHFPDLYIASNDSLGKATLAGLTSEVYETENWKLLSYFPETALNAVTYHDQVVGYPLYFVTSSLIYNKTYLENWAKIQMEAEVDQAIAEQAQADADAGNVEEGTTLEDAEEIEVTAEENDNIQDESVEVLTKEQLAEIDERVNSYLPESFDDILNFADQYDAPEQVEGVLKWDVTDIFYNYFVVGDAILVGGIHGDDLSQIDLYNEPAIKSLKLYQDLHQFFSIDTDAIQYDGVVQDFIDGKIVYMIATPDCLSTIEMAKKEGLFDYEYGVAPLPDTNEDVAAKSLSVTTAVVVNGYSEKKEAANQFAKYLCTQNGENLYHRTGKVSALTSVQYENPLVGEFMKEYERSAPVAKMIETSNYWIKLEVAFAQIWDGENPNQILKALSEEIMTQVTGEKYTEETIVIEEVVEETEYTEEVTEEETQE